MPSYKVISSGFFAGKLYRPDGKRRTLTVDKPFKKTPKWLEPIKAVTPAEKKALAAADAKQAKQVAEDAEKVEGATFIGGGSGKVETL